MCHAAMLYILKCWAKGTVNNIMKSDPILELFRKFSGDNFLKTSDSNKKCYVKIKKTSKDEETKTESEFYLQTGPLSSICYDYESLLRKKQIMDEDLEKYEVYVSIDDHKYPHVITGFPTKEPFTCNGVAYEVYAIVFTCRDNNNFPDFDIVRTNIEDCCTNNQENKETKTTKNPTLNESKMREILSTEEVTSIFDKTLMDPTNQAYIEAKVTCRCCKKKINMHDFYNFYFAYLLENNKNISEFVEAMRQKSDGDL